MRPSDNATAPDIEAQTRRLLTRYAEGMPSETSVEVRVRSALATQPQQQRRTLHLPSWGAMSGWARGAVSLTLVIALLVTFAAVLRLRANHPSRNPTPLGANSCPIVQPNTLMIKLCPDDHISAKIVVGQTYADATRTAVMIHINLTNAGLKLGKPAALVEPDAASFNFGTTLQDSQGHSYYANNFTTSINYNPPPTFPGTSLGTAGIVEFDPLPQAMLELPQKLTIHFTSILLNYPVKNGEAFQGEAFLALNGSWTVSFQVTPHPGRSITIDTLPQTFNGITIQPTRLDIGPSGTPFDLLASGARLTLRISGLAPDTLRSTLANMAYKFSRSDGSGASAEPGNGPLLLFEGREPASIVGVVAPENAPLSLDPIVGPTGVMNLEVIFLGIKPPTPNQPEVVTLTLNELCVALSPTEKTVPGDWSFKITLR